MSIVDRRDVKRDDDVEEEEVNKESEVSSSWVMSIKGGLVRMILGLGKGTFTLLFVGLLI